MMTNCLNILRRSALVLVCLFLASCDSTNPLSRPDDSKPDAALAGVWRMQDKEGLHYFHLGRLVGRAPASVMLVASVDHAADGTLSGPGQTLLFPTTLGKNTYLNIASDLTPEQYRKLQKDGWAPEMIKSYLLLRYRLDGDTLLVWAMDEAAKANAIRAGKIKGDLPKNGNATLTDTTANLAKWVEGEGDALFKRDPVKFERQK